MTSPWIHTPIPSKSILLEWSKSLRYFRYYRHYGGHSSVEDEVVVAFLPTAMNIREIEKIKSLAKAHGQSLSVHEFSDRILLGVSDNQKCAITERSIEAASVIEKTLKSIENLIVEPPIESPHCFSPKTHPEIWD